MDKADVLESRAVDGLSTHEFKTLNPQSIAANYEGNDRTSRRESGGRGSPVVEKFMQEIATNHLPLDDLKRLAASRLGKILICLEMPLLLTGS